MEIMIESRFPSAPNSAMYSFNYRPYKTTEEAIEYLRSLPFCPESEFRVFAGGANTERVSRAKAIKWLEELNKDMNW